MYSAVELECNSGNSVMSRHQFVYSLHENESQMCNWINIKWHRVNFEIEITVQFVGPIKYIDIEIDTNFMFNQRKQKIK